MVSYPLTDQAVAGDLRQQEREMRCVEIRKLRRVFQTPDGEKVAVKTLGADSSPHAVSREINAMRRVGAHEHVVALHGYFSAPHGGSVRARAWALAPSRSWA